MLFHHYSIYMSCVTKTASFPVNLRDWLPSDSRDRRRGAQAGVLQSSIHCLIGMDPLVVCCPLVDKEQAPANQAPETPVTEGVSPSENLPLGHCSRVRLILRPQTGP